MLSLPFFFISRQWPRILAGEQATSSRGEERLAFSLTIVQNTHLKF